jgi:predicted metal-binding membrane protein
LDESGRRSLTPEISPGVVERLFRFDRRLILASLLLLAALAWVYLIMMVASMADGDMSMMGLNDGRAMDAMLAAPQPWTPQTFMLMFCMWWIMMIGMMVPNAAPMILLFGRVQRRQLAGQAPYASTGLFALAYLLVWAAFSALATLAQWSLNGAAVLAPIDMRVGGAAASVILVAGGVYQLTPFKQACLEHCRSPAQFLASRWRKGKAGALRMGIEHGAYCVGCCWSLMALLFVGGVMNLLWVAGLALLVMAEKLVPRGDILARVTGYALLAASVIVAAFTLT